MSNTCAAVCGATLPCCPHAPGIQLQMHACSLSITNHAACTGAGRDGTGRGITIISSQPKQGTFDRHDPVVFFYPCLVHVWLLTAKLPRAIVPGGPRRWGGIRSTDGSPICICMYVQVSQCLATNLSGGWPWPAGRELPVCDYKQSFIEIDYVYVIKQLILIWSFRWVREKHINTPFKLDFVVLPKLVHGF